MTSSIQFQPDRIFARNDLFKRISKSCEATNVEFLMLKEKPVLCPYEVICNEKEFILMPETQHDVEQLEKKRKNQ